MNDCQKNLRKVLAQKELTFSCGIVADGVRIMPELTASDLSDGKLHLSFRYPDSGVCEDLFFTWQERSLLMKRRLYNRSERLLKLNELFCSFGNLVIGERTERDYFYHLENPRIYERFCIPVDEDRTGAKTKDSGFDPLSGNRWADPGTVHDRIGRSPYQAFPAILLANFDLAKGLVHGSLSQNVFYHCYLVEHNAAGKLDFQVISAFKAIEFRNVQPNEVLEDEWYFGQTENADDIERIFEAYSLELRKVLPANYGASSINRHSLVWGSWNDGIYRDIHADRLLECARFIKRNFPTVEWIQIDDGYSVEACRLEIAHGLGMPYEGEKGIDKSRFPNGMKDFYDRIRTIGLRPAIWIGGFCPKDTPIFRDHPEWFCDYDYRVKGSWPLDVSKPEVWAYMMKALDMLVTEFGCEGVKHDFWSYVFEDSTPLLANQDASGYEYRRKWLVELRKRLSSSGYLQTGCDIVMGNPFLGEYFTNYRYGIDIGGGNWDFVKTSFLWGSACFATHTGDLIVPNSDSVGVYPELNDSEAEFCLNYCLITGSMVEISGYLHEQDGNPRMAMLKKAVCCPDNGADVFFAGFNYRAGHRPPEQFFTKGAFFSLLDNQPLLPLRTLGLFNIDDEAAVRGATVAELGLEPGEYLAYDVWHGGVTEFSDRLSLELPAHGSRLFSIAKKSKQAAILDANIKIDAAILQDNSLKIRFAHAGDLTMRVWNGSCLIEHTKSLEKHGETIEITVA